jgi:chromosome segregation ATPase
VLDEVLDTALDGIGVQLAANLIKQKAIDESLTMFVISHREELASTFPNIMTIQLKDGFSNVKPK